MIKFLGFMVKCIFITVIIFSFIIFRDIYTKDETNTTVKKSKKKTIKTEDFATIDMEIINKGIGKFVGKKDSDLKREFGEPRRIDTSLHSISWWIYNFDPDVYYQFIVNNEGTVLAATGTGNKAHVMPFSIGQSSQIILQHISSLNQIDVEVNNELYRLELSELQVSSSPIVAVENNEGLYIQIYFDTVIGEVAGIRFIDSELLLGLLINYEMIGNDNTNENGEEIQQETIASVEEGLESQIYELVNLMRRMHDLDELMLDDKVATVAREHSNDMYVNDFFSHEALDGTDASDRMFAAGITYTDLGENIANGPNDMFTIVQGWMNSYGHREVMLSDKFNATGIGVRGTYYSQNFIKKIER